MLSPNTVTPPLAMDDNSSSPRQLCRSSSFPSRIPSAFKSPSSIARPHNASLTRPSTKPPPAAGSMASSIQPSALLQRRSKAGHGFSVSAVNTGTSTISDPPPPASSCTKHPTAYDVLQVSPSASQQDIKSAFWRLARQHHPDKVPCEQKDASTIAFLQIHSAYVSLKDPEARARHDAQMAMDSLGNNNQRFSGIAVDVKAPFTYKPYTNIYTTRGSTAAAPSRTPFTPRTQIFTPSTTTAASTPRNHGQQAPKPPSTGASPNYYTPRSPYSRGRSWETDQCW